jgi:hypothetical protein
MPGRVRQDNVAPTKRQQIFAPIGVIDDQNRLMSLISQEFAGYSVMDTKKKGSVIATEPPFIFAVLW